VLLLDDLRGGSSDVVVQVKRGEAAAGHDLV